jgi:hypothetical protein
VDIWSTFIRIPNIINFIEVSAATEKCQFKVKQKKKILERIVSIPEEFLQSAGSEINYQKISDNTLDISCTKYTAFNLFDEDGSKFRTVAFSAPDGVIKNYWKKLCVLAKIFVKKILGKDWK